MEGGKVEERAAEIKFLPKKADTINKYKIDINHGKD